MSMFYKLTSYLPSFFYSQLFNTPPPPTTPCTSRTFIVTGANTGLGKAAAAHFARLGAGRIVLACRDEAKGAAAKREIDASLPDGGVGTAVEVWPLDLSCYDSVRAFAARVNALDRVDVVLENAGLATKDFRLAEGEEMTVTVNVWVFLLRLREGDAVLRLTRPQHLDVSARLPRPAQAAGDGAQVQRVARLDHCQFRGAFHHHCASLPTPHRHASSRSPPRSSPSATPPTSSPRCPTRPAPACTSATPSPSCWRCCACAS